MGRINAILDKEVAYGFEGGPEYATNVVDMVNGFDERDAKKKYPRHHFNASFENINNDDRDTLINVFHACRGQLHSFMMRDYNDYVIEDQLIEVNPGTTAKIQLYKSYEFGEAYTIRPIFAIEESTVTLKDENDDDVAGTFDLLTGEFTPVGAWGIGEYRLSCQFYVWVRFKDDYNPMTINAWRTHTADVELIEDPMKITATNVPLSWDE